MPDVTFCTGRSGLIDRRRIHLSIPPVQRRRLDLVEIAVPPDGRDSQDGGYGVLVEIVLGILGGVLGGWIFDALGIWHSGGMIGSIIVAFVGAGILVWNTRFLEKA